MPGLFSSLVNSSRIADISHAQIPSPPTAELKGDHCFVNVMYADAAEHLDVSNFVAAAFEDTIKILQKFASSHLASESKSICISYYVRTGKFSGRALRISILTEKLAGHSSFDSSKIQAIATITSEVNPIEEHLQSEAI